jgi:hypothetical protein
MTPVNAGLRNRAPCGMGFVRFIPLQTIHAVVEHKCKVLRELLDEDRTLPNALNTVQETLGMIRELELLLPASSTISFRERLIAHKEALEKNEEPGDIEREFLVKAGRLLNYYEDLFGVDDFIDYDS